MAVAYSSSSGFPSAASSSMACTISALLAMRWSTLLCSWCKSKDSWFTSDSSEYGEGLEGSGCLCSVALGWKGGGWCFCSGAGCGVDCWAEAIEAGVRKSVTKMPGLISRSGASAMLPAVCNQVAFGAGVNRSRVWSESWDGEGRVHGGKGREGFRGRDSLQRPEVQASRPKVHTPHPTMWLAAPRQSHRYTLVVSPHPALFIAPCPLTEHQSHVAERLSTALTLSGLTRVDSACSSARMS